MITKIQGEAPFQVLTNNFSISPSNEGYTLQISADGKNYSNLFTVGANVTRLVTGVAANSYYRLLGNESEVSINWMKTCVTEGQGGGGNAGELEPVSEFPVGVPEGTVVALASGDTMGVYQYDGSEWIPVAGGDMSNYYTKAQTNAAITAATATETARTENTYAKIADIPSLDGYWTSAQTNNAITAATDDMATKTWVGEQGYLTQHQDISGKLDVSVFTGYTGTTDTTISGKLDTSDFNTYTGATETALSGKVDNSVFTGYTGATETALSGKVDNSVFTGYTGDTATALAGKVDTSVYTAYTASTDTALSGKQETLVSGTNIKTINNQSLLGSGNIDIQGGGGGSVVELTKAQYDALDPPAQDTTYIITDAETVDLNDYAMASGLTELSSSTATALATKADKQNVTANTSLPYFPAWNNQGVITGNGTRAYTKSSIINGTTYYVYSEKNDTRPNIYAPTSAGTAGQPLLSNGSSSAPVWGGYKFAFITQTAYNALTTKDATTIYFIVGE